MTTTQKQIPDDEKLIMLARIQKLKKQERELKTERYELETLLGL